MGNRLNQASCETDSGLLVTHSLFPIPYSLFPIPYFLFPIPDDFKPQWFGWFQIVAQ